MFDSGWIFDTVDSSSTLVGLCLGYDHCAEHYLHGAALDDFRWYMGMTLSSGARGSSVKRPHYMKIETFSQRSFDRRIKPFEVNMLVAGEMPWSSEKHHARLRAETKVVDPQAGIAIEDDTPRSRLMCAWGREGIAVQVRGDDYTRNLHDLTDRLWAGDVEIAPKGLRHPGIKGAGLTLIIPSRMSAFERLQEGVVGTVPEPLAR